jgi:elongation factor P
MTENTDHEEGGNKCQFVERVEEEKMSAGGIVIPDNAAEKPIRGKILAVGNGKVLDNTFPAGVKITPVRVERRVYQYLYQDESGYHFMNTENYEQTFIRGDLINAPQFLKEGENVEILVHAEEENPLLCELPPFMEFEVTYTEPGIKGDTATNTLKLATLETGAEVRVPLFIEIGDRVKIDTRNGAYVERVKS